jgi:BASS family bile acid:Na+ symporter
VRRLTDLFPLWVLLGSGLALAHPPAFTWFSGPLIVWGLAVIMLGMGITLTAGEFRAVLAAPGPVLLGVAAQFGIMPLAGWTIARGLGLEPPLAVGLVLLACCPGGTASNVVTYIARANVALSVLMTACSTIAAVALTPLLTAALAGAWVPIDGWGLFWSTVQVVLLPVVMGVALNRRAPGLVRVVLPVAPLIAVAAIVLICASIIGQNRAMVATAGARVLLAVGLLHAAGFGLGWGVARVLGFDERTARTASIEVGMQNSGLGVVLAMQHFASPLTALPSAVSATVHSLFGSMLAARWRRSPP